MYSVECLDLLEMLAHSNGKSSRFKAGAGENGELAEQQVFLSVVDLSSQQFSIFVGPSEAEIEERPNGRDDRFQF